MKRRTLISATILALSTLANGVFAAGEHGDHKPQHGGILVETKQLDIELVAGPKVIHIYLTDHGKPVDLRKASAKLTLMSGAQKQEVELKPAGNRLEALGTFAIEPGARAIVVVTGASKSPATARFTLK